MISWLVLGIFSVVFLYAFILRVVWRRAEKNSPPQTRTFIFDSSSTSVRAAEQLANNSTLDIKGLGFRVIGLTGEIMPAPSHLLCPVSSLFSSSRRAVALAWCAESAQCTTLLLFGENGIPPFLISAFDPDYVLVTAVGNGDSMSEVGQAKQYAATLSEAWLLHEETLTVWEGEGHTAVKNDAKRIWEIANQGLAEFFQPAPPGPFELESYYQKCAFILAGGVVSFGLGVTLALWL